MTRVLLSHQAGSIELPQGDTLVGRGLSCSIRFNDPGVSREHLRITVSGDIVIVEEMRSTNGTLINGKRLEGTAEIRDGDELQIGFRWLSVRVVSGEADAPDEDEITASGHEAFPSSGPGPDDDLACVLKPQPAALAAAPPRLDKVTCPRCRALLDAALTDCPKCGHHVRAIRHRSVTRRVKAAGLDRRSAPRCPVDIPLLYSSDTLTFDAVARDLSVGGIFVASQLLDPVGTRCTITVLPDGAPPVSLLGVVSRVVESEGSGEDKPAGLGVRFDKLNDETERWLAVYVEQSAPY